MSKNIKNTIKNKINTLLETKGFEDMEVAFGVKHKSDNLSDVEKAQFGSLETIQDKETGLVKLGEPTVQPALNKVHKEDVKDAEEYYKMVLDRMRNFQKTDVSEPSQIGEAFEPKKVNRKDDQTKEDDVYDTEALGIGMHALRYDNEGTPVHDEFIKRQDKLNGNDSTYLKLRAYSEKYLKHKYGEPDEYHYTPKIRATDKPVNENEKYSDVIKENIFKVKGEIKSKEQVIKLTEKLPSRVKMDETVFAITDGNNYYRLIWEGKEDGEAVITHEKNSQIVNESIDKMKHLWGFNSSKTTSTKNINKQNEDENFKKMFRNLKK
jgi:hypothetical protein